jgi:CopG-like RHH_1 or ribbon-helix-helix domain, RHH_5
MAEERRKRGPKGGRERFQLVIPKDVLEEARELADTENRSISNMLATLVAEAIKTRREKRGEPGQWLPALMAA